MIIIKITVEESKVLAQIRFKKEIEGFNNRLESEKLLVGKSNKYYRVAEKMARETSYSLNECLILLMEIDNIKFKKENGLFMSSREIMILEYLEMI